MDGIILLFFLISLEAFLGSHPALINISVNVDHEFEDDVEHCFQSFLVFLDDGWLSFDDGHEELNRLVSDGHVGEVILSDDGRQLEEEVFEVASKKLWLDLCDFIELN